MKRLERRLQKIEAVANAEPPPMPVIQIRVRPSNPADPASVRAAQAKGYDVVMRPDGSSVRPLPELGSEGRTKD